MAPKVALHENLARQLIAQKADPEELAEMFADWRVDWPKYRFTHQMFGKDGGYGTPRVNGVRNVLRHVHLIPVFDAFNLKSWMDAFSRFGEKRSDRVLVYVEGRPGYYLLIFILPEGRAHEIATMMNSRDKALMETFALIADNFIHTTQFQLSFYTFGE